MFDRLTASNAVRSATYSLVTVQQHEDPNQALLTHSKFRIFLDCDTQRNNPLLLVPIAVDVVTSPGSVPFAAQVSKLTFSPVQRPKPTQSFAITMVSTSEQSQDEQGSSWEWHSLSQTEQPIIVHVTFVLTLVQLTTAHRISRSTLITC